MRVDDDGASICCAPLIEMDLDDYPDLMSELQYRRFFIHPSGDKIVVKRKKEV